MTRVRLWFMPIIGKTLAGYSEMLGCHMRQGLKIDTILHPRLVTRQQAAKYCSLSVQGFSEWVRCGRLPSAIPGTTRWDLKAIDQALDAASGISNTPASALDRWKAARDARKDKPENHQ